jgi:acyl CoA:acetate/3-ketoacid CoA transferase alpha subunit
MRIAAGGLHGIPERLIDGIEKAGTKDLTVAS